MGLWRYFGEGDGADAVVDPLLGAVVLGGEGAGPGAVFEFEFPAEGFAAFWLPQIFGIEALAAFTRSGALPTPQQRAAFRYPELGVDWQPSGALRFTRRAWAKFQMPGRHVTTVTQPAHFRR